MTKRENYLDKLNPSTDELIQALQNGAITVSNITQNQLADLVASIEEYKNQESLISTAISQLDDIPGKINGLHATFENLCSFAESYDDESPEVLIKRVTDDFLEFDALHDELVALWNSVTYAD